jgi:hypothetical protein
MNLRWKGGSGNRGRAVCCEGSGLNVASGGGIGGSQTGSYDHSGGGKAPDFWCAFEEGEVKVIGDEPANR